ncbi:MAG: 6-phosphogluconolactonase [Solirubrobacteraceae bacterium]
MTRLTSCPDDETVARRAAAHVARVTRHAFEQRGVAHLAVSGGTTPGHTYELIGQDPPALQGVELWFADERCVPPEDEESNYRLVAQTLLAGGAIPPERVHRMQGELGPQQGADRYAIELAGRIPPPPEGVLVLDLIVLGIGPDGHVASLFPGSSTLSAGEHAICLPVTGSPKPPPERITLSLAVLRAARGCLLLATGPSKADAVNAMLGEPTPHVPASLLARERLTVIVDDAAAPDGPPR